MSIDLDRGCIKRTHPAGMQIVMYVDAPGVYLDERGVMVSSKLAQQAGYDITKLARDRERGARMEEYRQKVAQEFESNEEALARIASEGATSAEIRAVGKDAYAIFAEGERITSYDLSLQEAEGLLNSLAPENSDDGNSQDSAAETAAGKTAATAETEVDNLI